MATTYTNEGVTYAELLDDLRHRLGKAAGVEGADSVGAFFPIAKAGQSRAYGEFSSLSEWLDDVADTLQDFLDRDGEELEGWDA